MPNEIEMHGEFDLIARYFTRATPKADLGVGDDAALVRVAPHCQLVVSVDASVVGTHFYADCPPAWIGWKALAVNVSDMAAMGAMPKWITLALALPEQNSHWLAGFAQGFFDCATQFDIDLIGGDTTRGPLNITVQIMGEVPTGQALLRSGAQVGDDIWVSGMLGSAALGLAHIQKKLIVPDVILADCLKALHQPQPRLAIGMGLRGMAHSCIDISDGLIADLGHILKASDVGAEIDLEKVPCLSMVKQSLHSPLFQQAILSGGDDYELCFTVPKHKRAEIEVLSQRCGVPLTCIGEVTSGAGLLLTYQNQPLSFAGKGFDHFG
ncbi:thiamine-phosphate kinase [Methylotenera sp. N17]|uniref:thiamine-phosphate kinase n=1 Tax=Methylotenera sp. N17 TaxID=1502761 RepID=UPI000A6F2B8F|nr:thiamine-phosphate kinase [Methylotenera sp. N17]